MLCCREIILCFVPLLILMFVTGWVFKLGFRKKGSKRIIRGPGGFRIEVDESFTRGRNCKPWRYVHRKKTSRTSDDFEQWTCSCGNSVKPEESRCSACGKNRDEAILDTESVDIPSTDGSTDDPLGEGMIDLDE